MSYQTISQNYYEYMIQPGDTLSGIIFKMYDIGYGDMRYAKVVENLLLLNPHIKNPNVIKSGDILRLSEESPHVNVLASPFSSKPGFQMATINDLQCKIAPQTVHSLISEPIQIYDRANFWALSWLEHNSNFLTNPGGIAIGATTTLISKENIGLINDVNDLYAQYKLGELSKNQYSYARRLKLDQLKKNFGPFEKRLFGGKSTHQAIRIAKGGGVPANANIAKHVGRLNQLSKTAKVGGIVLTGVGLTASCMQIAHTNDSQKKNEIFVDTLASTTTSVVAGAVVGFFLVSNPVGWGTALVLAAGSAAVSYGAGKVAVAAYDTYGQRVDFVNGLGVSSICRPLQ